MGNMHVKLRFSSYASKQTNRHIHHNTLYLFQRRNTCSYVNKRKHSSVILICQLLFVTELLPPRTEDILLQQSLAIRDD